MAVHNIDTRYNDTLYNTDYTGVSIVERLTMQINFDLLPGDTVVVDNDNMTVRVRHANGEWENIRHLVTGDWLEIKRGDLMINIQSSQWGSGVMRHQERWL